MFSGEFSFHFAFIYTRPRQPDDFSYRYPSAQAVSCMSTEIIPKNGGRITSIPHVAGAAAHEGTGWGLPLFNGTQQLPSPDHEQYSATNEVKLMEYIQPAQTVRRTPASRRWVLACASRSHRYSISVQTTKRSFTRGAEEHVSLGPSH